MDENNFKLGDRVKVSNAEHLMGGENGTVVYTFGLSTEVKLDRGITLITSFRNLKKLAKKKKVAAKKKKTVAKKVKKVKKK